MFITEVSRTSIRIIVVLQVMALLMLFLPELNSPATVPITVDHVFVVEARSGGEERDDSDAECSGGVGTIVAVEGMMRVVGDESVVVVVVVVEGGSGCDDEEVAEADHAGHVWRGEAVVD